MFRAYHSNKETRDERSPREISYNFSIFSRRQSDIEPSYPIKSRREEESPPPLLHTDITQLNVPRHKSNFSSSEVAPKECPPHLPYIYISVKYTRRKKKSRGIFPLTRNVSSLIVSPGAPLADIYIITNRSRNCASPRSCLCVYTCSAYGFSSLSLSLYLLIHFHAGTCLSVSYCSSASFNKGCHLSPGERASGIYRYRALQQQLFANYLRYYSAFSYIFFFPLRGNIIATEWCASTVGGVN